MQENVNPMMVLPIRISKCGTERLTEIQNFLRPIFYRFLRVAFFLQKTEIHIYVITKYSQILKIYLSKTSFLASNLMALEQNVVC